MIARLNVGGPARHVVLLDRGLRERGYDTLLVHGSIGDGEASLERLATEEELETVKIPELGRRLHAVDDVKAFLSLLRIVFQQKPDVLHTHTAKAGALGRLAALLFNATRARRRRALVVHTFHGHVFEGYFGPRASAGARVMERLLGRVTDRVVAISPRQREDLVRRFRIVPDRRAATIPLGLDLETLLHAAPSADFRNSLGIEEGDVVLGYVGRFVPIKDLKTLVEAFAIAHRDLPRIRLLLAGDGPLRDEIEALVRFRRLTNAVTFLGWTDRLVDLYSAVDIGILSSINEGTPVAAIEAMAAAKPVIATEVGGVPDVIDHGRTGLLVQPRDVDALARAMAALATDAAARRSMGEAARKSVASRFSDRRLVDDIDHLYRAGVADKRGTIGRPS